MRNPMANIWHPLGGVEISNLGEKISSLGHEDSLCPTRLYNGEMEVGLGWDLSLRAVTKRATIATSVWLLEDIAKNNYGNTTDEKNKRSNWRNTNQEGMFRDQWVKTNQILGFNL
ncbi:hypothetical protein Golob_020082 [Gossypium lobatum]|uniref:Uncharacterized protein n=1 Tax=Gossypium lobatum TaxID=34289 RepID=A0A7J8L988_9ROSI|nr:hypothetical protein [Gossypium lobatum]